MSMEPEPEGKVEHKRVRRSWISSLPLLIIPLLAYVGFAAAGADFATSRFDVNLRSGGVWQIALGDILLVVALAEGETSGAVRTRRRLRIHLGKLLRGCTQLTAPHHPAEPSGASFVGADRT